MKSGYNMKPTQHYLHHFKLKWSAYVDYYELRVDKVVVSSCHLEQIAPKRYRLYAVYTCPDLRCRGYAYEMLFRILHSYHLHGATVNLTSTPVAVKLYLKLGFVRISTQWLEYQIKL